MTTKYIAPAVSAVCGTGAAIAGMTGGVTGGRKDASGIQSGPARAPLPRDRAAHVPSVDRVVAVRNRLQATGAPAASKGDAIECGGSQFEGPLAARIAGSTSRPAVAGSAPRPAFSVINVARADAALAAKSSPAGCTAN